MCNDHTITLYRRRHPTWLCSELGHAAVLSFSGLYPCKLCKLGEVALRISEQHAQHSRPESVCIYDESVFICE